MNKAIMKSINYLEKNIENFMRKELLLTDKNDQLKSFVELIFFYNLLPESIKESGTFDFIDMFILDRVRSVSIIDAFEENMYAISGLAVIEEYFLTRNQNYFSSYLQEIIARKRLDLKIVRMPFRYMDNKYSLNRVGIQDNLPSFDELFKKTVLGKKLSPFYYSESSMYSITHTIFYITDMGRGWKLAAQKPEWIIPLLRYLIVNRILEKDLDVLGELVLCVIFLDLSDDMLELLRIAKKFIIANQKKNGGFPAPVENHYISDYSEFRNIYHTTIVCLGALIWCEEKNI